MKIKNPDGAFSGRRYPVGILTNQAFSRAAGASLIPGNTVGLLRDAAENYPAWLKALKGAEKLIHFESYIIHEDRTGQEFAEVLMAKAREGVRVRLIYDWLGGWGKTSQRFWKALQQAGVEVRCFNPPRLLAPLDWIHRDHRKSIVVDNRVAFVSGLCIGKMWVGDPKRQIDPWRDTGLQLEGPAVADVARAFAEIWAEMGSPIPPDEIPLPDSLSPVGTVSLRVLAESVFMANTFRLDILVAALARERLWLTDAYYAGTPTYGQALRAASQDGVDVRLLVPGKGSDITLIQAISRAGYRPLLEAGVRVFEWNGSMIHAKTAVADGRWARVGSTNLNLASWIGNYELDVIVEDQAFGLEMEDLFLNDLNQATEIVLKGKRKGTGQGRIKEKRVRGAGGSAGRAMTGALRLGNAIGAAIRAQKEHGPAEAYLLKWAGFLLLVFTLVSFVSPRLIAYPLAALTLFLAMSFLLQAYRFRKKERTSVAQGKEKKLDRKEESL